MHEYDGPEIDTERHVNELMLKSEDCLNIGQDSRQNAHWLNDGSPMAQPRCSLLPNLGVIPFLTW